MRQPTDQPAAHQPLDDLIDEGLAAAGMLPTRERCEELNERLRAELHRLMPLVQRRTDRLDRGSTDWYARQTLLDQTRTLLEDDLGPGLRSAAFHVHDLARACRALADWASGR
ncbi:DUF6415 family natural product biosynthesis protein [Streptomyces sp. MS06]|uniref:DUF6415 family natural product biosynthesis protein n=1 Tax=Streptomyces sp. MS06 TaxID=3385974 RepID=UPI00399FF91C